MARNPRIVLPGCPYHITQRGSNRQDVFLTPKDRRVYLGLMRENMADAGVRLLAYCLMPNHVHLVAVPDFPDALAVWMRRVNGRYAQYFNASNGRSGHLWQARFFSCALSRQHLSYALRYVELNPVRARLAASPEKFPWSSAAEHVSSLPPNTLLDRDEWLDRGAAEGWSAMLGVVPTESETRLLRRCTYGGRPFGDENFIQSMEAQLGVNWRRWTYQKDCADIVFSAGETQKSASTGA